MNDESDPHDHALPEVVVPTPDTPVERTPSSPEPSEAPTTAPKPVPSPSTIKIARPTAPNPLRQFSLLGQADRFEERAQDTKPLLGELAMSGQATMFYAAPGTGKTLITVSLILDAIASKRINPSDLYYINADDSSLGLSEKLRLMQDVGAHVLAPGFQGFKTGDLLGLLQRGAEQDAARHTCVIIDTLKKAADLQSKKESSAFAQACRQYVMRGGTILALGHTTKNPNLDGTPRYSGTTDILDDFDAVFVLKQLTGPGISTEKVVQFSMLKCRAASPTTVTFAYAGETGITYHERLASVRLVDPDDLDGFKSGSEDVDDPPVMDAIVTLIRAGKGQGQMALAKAAAQACGISHKAALGVLHRYTGTTPKVHLWTFQKGSRGVRLYELTPQT